MATYPAIPEKVANFYEKVMTLRALPHLVHANFGSPATIKQGAGDTYVWHVMPEFSAVTTPMDIEGLTPPAQGWTVTELTATTAPYGAYVAFTSRWDKSDPDGGVTRIAEELGRQAGLSIDTITRDVICAGYTARYADNVANRGSVVATIDWDDFVDAMVALMATNAKPFANGRYVVVMPTMVWGDLLLDPTFQEIVTMAADRGDRNPYMRGYIGSVLQCDLYVTTQGKKYAGAGSGGADVYATLFIGQDSYGVVGLHNAVPRYLGPTGVDVANATGADISPVKAIIKDANHPMNMVSTAAWLVELGVKVLRGDMIIGYESTA